MKINVLLAACMALAMGSCGSDSSEESAAMQQPGFPGWRSAGAVTISPRTYTGGTVTATSTSGECARAEVEVTPTLVRGRYSCSGSTGYNNQTREMGKVEIEVEFSAGS